MENNPPFTLWTETYISTGWDGLNAARISIGEQLCQDRCNTDVLCDEQKSENIRERQE